jgi:hypothetical protein
LEQSREKQLLEHIKQDFTKQVDVYLKREKTLRINKEIEQRDSSYSKCRNIIEILLNISDTCYSHKQVTVE